jgi:hypothetical protein
MNKSQYQTLQQTTQYDYVNFCKHLVIPCFGTQVKTFSEVAEPWQWKDAELFSKVLGNLWGITYPIRNIWLTRPRGHDKTSSIARLVLWCLLFKRENVAPLNVYAAAVDKEQAGILLDSLREIVTLNGFNDLVKVTRSGTARSFGGKLTILSSDASSSYGLKANIIILDEITHWTTPKSRSFFEALWSGRSKMKNTITIVITNSGFKNTWQYNLLQSLKRDPSWYIYDEPGRLAQWHGNIEEMVSGLSHSSYRRLVLNEWVDDETISLYTLFLDNIAQQLPDIRGCSRAIISIDYASSRDLTAIAITLIHNECIYITDIIAGHFQQEEIEQRLIQIYRMYADMMPVDIVADRYQMEYMHSRMRNIHGINITLIKPTKQLNMRAVNNLHTMMTHGKVLFVNPYMGPYAGETLDTEMRNITIDLANGKVSTSQVGLHDDRFHAVMYAVHHAVEQRYLSIVQSRQLPKLDQSNNHTTHILPDLRQLYHRTSVFGLDVKPGDNFTNEFQRKVLETLKRLERNKP